MKKILKYFYHIWAWRPTCSIARNHAIFSPYWYIGKQIDLPWKGQRSTYGHHLNKLGRPWVLNATYTKIQPQSFLGSGEEDFQVFLPYMGMAVILFDGAEYLKNKMAWTWRPSCSIARSHLNKLAKPFWQKAPCEVWKKLLKRFKRRRHLKITQFYRCILPRVKSR